MNHRFLGGVATAALLATAVLAPLTAAHAELVYGIGDTTTALGAAGFTLIRFDSANPSAVTTIGSITGLTTGQFVRGIDFRPANGQLYLVSAGNTTADGAAAQLYTVNLSTGALTTVGAGFAIAGNTSTRVSIDFNPVVDRLRVVTGNNLNFRVNPNDGTLAATDTTIAYAAGDPNAATAPLLGDIAYTNNVVGATSTTLYGYEYALDNLTTVGSVGGTPVSPNAGSLFTVGATGVSTSSAGIGFDISGATGIGYLNTDTGASTVNNFFYTVNLSTGTLTTVGAFGADVLDISVAPVAVAVPEPGTFALLGAGLLPIMGLVRRARRKVA